MTGGAERDPDQLAFLASATPDEPVADERVADETYTVRGLNEAIAEALNESFAREVWVRGEIQQLRRSNNGHVYFELVEKDGNRDNVRAVLRVALFKNDRASVNRSLKATPGVTIEDGVEVRIRGRVDFWPPAGRLQLVMTGIDGVFTVGKLAADRERVLRVLAAEGLLGRNGALELVPVPLRIGLVTSGGSAAYHDFMHELTRGGYAFRVAHADVRVQGAGAWRRIAYALRKVAATQVDVIVLVRGGGSRSDLAPFDAEGVARAITEMPVPVLTGIGHEVDRTVADEVAHTSAKTPTAIAALLVDAIDEYCEDLSRLAHRVSLRARGACALADRELGEIARRVQRSVPVVLAAERQLVDHQQVRLLEVARRGSRDASRALDGVEARVRALDPRRVLERGYTITRTKDGTIVRAAAAVTAGDVVVTETGDGTVQSRVEGISDAREEDES